MDTLGSQGNRHALIQNILRYLMEHPEAKDTAEGVMQWWITKGDADYHQEEVEKALDELVTEGWVVRRPPLPSLYGLNKERVVDIQQFLQNGYTE